MSDPVMPTSATAAASNKLITVVIPVFNRERLLVRTLDSIAAQDTRRIRLVIVDNASADGSRRVAEQWCRAHAYVDAIVTGCEVPGAAAARNAGLRLADTPYVMFFDSDDEMLPGHLEMVVRGIGDHPEADILGWPVRLETATAQFKSGYFHQHAPLCKHLVHSTMSTLRFAASTDLLRRAGGWDEAISGWDDYELGVRLLVAAGRVANINAHGEPTVRVNFTEESITGTGFADNPAKWERALDAVERDLAAECPHMLGWVDYRRAVLAAEYAREGNSKDAARLRALAADRRGNKLMVRLSYFVHRHFGRGSWRVASFFLPGDC